MSIRKNAPSQRLLICYALVTTLLFQAGCIHMKSRARATVKVENPAGPLFITLQSADLNIESIIYTPSKLPLEDFFRRLKSGELKDAFRRIDLSYQPSNVDNKILQELIEEGFIPVYVRARNLGDKRVAIAENNFILTDGTKKFAPISPEDLPQTIKRFSPAAAGANIYNAGVVVVSVAAVVAILVALGRGGGGNLGGIGKINFGGESDGPPPKTEEAKKIEKEAEKAEDAREDEIDSDGSRVFNKVETTTVLDYQGYLLQSTVLDSNELTRGLLFFQIDPDVDPTSLRLERP